MTTTPFEGLPPPSLPPGSALVFQASLWWGVVAFGPRSYEQRAREQLAALIDRAPDHLSEVYAAVRDAAAACLAAPTDLQLRAALGAALDRVIDRGRAMDAAPADDTMPPAEEVWWRR
jgi:hypothetical protein